MTRDEAIFDLQHVKQFLVESDSLTDAEKEALDMAIEALERPHGEWVDKWHRLFKEELPMCSVCNNFSLFKSNYCPGCGADMRGEENDKG